MFAYVLCRYNIWNVHSIFKGSAVELLGLKYNDMMKSNYVKERRKISEWQKSWGISGYAKIGLWRSLCISGYDEMDLQRTWSISGSVEIELWCQRKISGYAEIELWRSWIISDHFRIWRNLKVKILKCFKISCPWFMSVLKYISISWIRIMEALNILPKYFCLIRSQYCLWL